MVTHTRYLFIEGSRDSSNGDLREGFSKLIGKKLVGNKPRISMGAGKQQTIDKFRNTTNSMILCDLDGPSSEIAVDLKKCNLADVRSNVFYMIQEMESWFLSQPNILDEFYNSEISRRLAKKHGSEFSEPDKELKRITRDTVKGQYHKVNHGSQLLKLLDPQRLFNDFPDFKRLIETLEIES